MERIYFTKLKNKTLSRNRTEVIYEITCDCNKTYIGETSQQFTSRRKQHSCHVKVKKMDILP